MRRNPYPISPTPTLALLLALLATGCQGETQIVLEADRTTISAGGIDKAVITAQAFLFGDPVATGTKISFETTSGSFSSSSTDTTTLDKSADDQGKTTASLYSSQKQESATVTASFTDNESGMYASSSITITFGPPSGTNMPVDGTFRISCDAVNIGALRQPLPDIKVTCTMAASTRKSVSIPASSLSPEFLTEAGGFEITDDSYTGKRILVYSPKKGTSTPKDVEPEQTLSEPSYYDKNGAKRNPRDGLVTLVAILDGEEAFTDSNGNGTYDQGEPFVDSSEPFVDKDDDDKHDADETYKDVNSNGKWDLANGKWDAKTKIAAIYKILWTGALDSSSKTSRIETATGTTTISDSGKLELVAYVVDVNLNPLAAFTDNSDYLEWTLSAGSSDATTNDDTSPVLKNALGFTFDKSASTERKRWLIVSNSFVTSKFKLTVEDGYPADGTSNPSAWSATVKAYVTAGPAGDGYYTTQVTEPITEKMEGTCD